MRLCSGLKKQCCLIVAAVLFVAGICFQSFETYSYLERNLQSEIQSASGAVDDLSQQPELAGMHNYGISAGVIVQEMLLDYASRGTQEVSGARISSITRAVETCVSTSIRLFLVCSVLAVLSKNIQKEKMLARGIEDAGSRVWDLMSRYIHLKDGEKD